MEADLKLLSDVIANARMGIEAVDLLMSKTGDEGIRAELSHQRGQYDGIMREAEDKLRLMGGEPPAPNAAKRAGAWVGVQANTLIDHTSSHLADMVIQGDAMGIIGMSRARNENPNADPEALDLADRLIDASRQGIERSREFL